MTRNEVEIAIKRLEPELRTLGVRTLSLFGSVLRGEETPTSDIDLVAQFSPPHTAKQYFDTLFLIEDALGVHVDLPEPETLHPAIRDRILSEACRVA